MRAASPIVSVVLALVLAPVAGTAAWAQPGPASAEWKTLRTPHLTVAGDANGGDLPRLGRDVERFRDAMAAIPALRFDESVPTVVVVFRDDAAMRPFKPRVRGKTTAIARPPRDISRGCGSPAGRTSSSTTT